MKLAYGLAGDGSQRRLAQALGEESSTVSSWVMRNSVPMRAFLTASQQSGRSLDWLIRGVGAPSQIAISSKSQNASADLKISSYSHDKEVSESGGGRWSLVVDDGRTKLVYTLVPKLRADSSEEITYGDTGPVGEFAFQSAWMERTLGRSGDGFCLVDVTGDAMAPTFLNGDTILVDRQHQVVDAGGIFVVRRGSELLVRRIHRQMSGALQISSDNPAVLPEVLPPDLTIHVIGKVVWPRSR